jgi:hypothetical protein
MSLAQSPQDSFRLILLTVMGQALAAAGYALEERPTQWAGGQFRFVRLLEDGASATITFQLLAYVATAFAEPQPSRFRVMLARSGAAPLSRALSALVVTDFGVAILPDADHWWAYNDVTSLGRALAEAGHLLVGYGIPWLAGALKPKGDTE